MVLLIHEGFIYYTPMLGFPWHGMNNHWTTKYSLWSFNSLLLKMVIYNGFTHWTWWFHSFLYVYQRVYHVLTLAQMANKNGAHDAKPLGFLVGHCHRYGSRTGDMGNGWQWLKPVMTFPYDWRREDFIIGPHFRRPSYMCMELIPYMIQIIELYLLALSLSITGWWFGTFFISPYIGG